MGRTFAAAQRDAGGDAHPIVVLPEPLNPRFDLSQDNEFIQRLSDRNAPQRKYIFVAVVAVSELIQEAPEMPENHVILPVRADVGSIVIDVTMFLHHMLRDGVEQRKAPVATVVCHDPVDASSFQQFSRLVDVIRY
jgi:hypothetical protein